MCGLPEESYVMQCSSNHCRDHSLSSLIFVGNRSSVILAVSSSDVLCEASGIHFLPRRTFENVPSIPRKNERLESLVK